MKETITYQRELQQTFLIMKAGRDSILDEYQGRMILENELKNFIKCGPQLIDGNYEIRFDISSCQTLEQAFAVKELGYEDLSRLIGSVMEAVRESEEYLIDSRRILFDPEFIFWDFKTKAFKFLFDFSKEEAGESICDLGSFLIERTCHEEEKAVDLAYFFFERVSKNDFSVSELKDYIEELETETEKKKKEREKEIAPIREQTELSEQKRKPQQEEEPLPKQDFLPEPKFPSKPEWEHEKEGKQKERKFSWESREGFFIEAGLVLVVLAVLSEISFLLIQFFYLLEPTEKRIWIGVSLGLLLIGLAAAGYGIFLRKFAGNRKKDAVKTKRKSGKEAITKKPPESGFAELWKASEDIDLLEWEENRPKHNEEAEEEKTVYVGKSLLEKEHYLIEMKKGREIRHAITAYPFFIGKEKERVHLQLNDRSVSRIHAKFYKEDEAVFLEDLCSTNGTYLNDLILTPHEKMKLQRGDAIMFGKAEVIFR